MVVHELPTGSVTLLFTDIEGSTQLIEELGEDGYVQALAEHRRSLRAAFVAHDGVEVDTQGDAFLYAFADADEAVAAASEAQSALASGPVRVRMGLHTGELLLTGEGYAGRELHRAARIAATGHGGQVVVSAATRAMVSADLSELGEHRLKDFDAAVPLFQLGRDPFPPLKTISNTNLPRPASSFVGRERERDEIVGRLDNGTRLLTLSGPGGSGKTRLAVEAASELVSSFKAGVFWVGLAALRDPGLVRVSIAQTLGSKNGLADHIGERELLLVVDNFEQVVEAAPELGELLASCPNLKLMITSRELLRIDGEVDYPVLPLRESEAVELFSARSGLAPDETVPELCRRLDDLPLALELAAARTSVLSPAQILERLSQRLDLLKGGRDTDPRQQTLRSTIEWSHDLLDEREQALFAHLAVFRGGCTLQAAEKVAGADLDTLQSLVDKSLLRHAGERFWMLETIREYARERLVASSHEAGLRRSHALFALDVAESATREMEEGGDQAVELARIGAEHDNLRAALEWARDEREDELLLRLAAAIEYFWSTRGLHEEKDAWVALALERASSPVEARMKVLRSACRRAGIKGDYARADELIAEWRSLAEEVGDEYQVLLAMNSAATSATDKGDHGDARAQLLALEQRANATGNTEIVAFAKVNLALVASRSRDFETGVAFAADAARIFRELRDDLGVGVALLHGGWCAFGIPDLVRAEKSFREVLVVAGRLGAIALMGWSAHGLGTVLVARHEEDPGVQLLAAAASLRKEAGVGFRHEQEEQEHDRAIADARAVLGDEAFAAAWARGEAMMPDEVAGFAS